MAGARAVASLSLTIGVAFATCLVTAGILAGPAILDCSHDPNSFGACLRHKIEARGLVTPLPGASSQPPEISEQASASPPSAEPSSSSEPPLSSSEPVVPVIAQSPIEGSWMEAHATEYEPPSLPQLAATPASASPPTFDQSGLPPHLGGGDRGGGPSEPETAVTADIAPSNPIAPSSSELPPTLDPSPQGGGSRLLVSVQPPPDQLANVTTEPSVWSPSPLRGGDRGGGPSEPETAVTADIAPEVGVPGIPPDPVTTATIAPAADPVAPPLPRPRPLALMAAADTPPPAAAPKPTLKPKPPAAIHRTYKYDPRYPDILMLPPPAKGADSSFITLQTR